MSERSIRPGLLLTAGRAMAFAVTFMAPLVLARVLTQSEFGTYKQLIVMFATIAAIAQLGMADSLLYFLPSGDGRGGRYVLNGLTVLAASGLVCFTFFTLGGPMLARWFSNEALSGLARLIGVYVLLILPSTVLEIVLTARRRYAAAGLAYGLSDLARAIAFVVPAVLTRRLEWLLAGAAIFAAARLTVTLLYLHRTYRREMVFDREALRRHLGYALPLQLGVALWILVQNLHYYVVAAKVDAATFAIYAAGCLQIPIVDILSTPARNLLTVGMRGAITANRPAAALELWHDTTRRLAMVFFPLVGLLLATAHDLIPLLFTDRYAASVPIFMVWSTIALLLAVQVDGVLAVYADTRAIALTHAVQLVLMAALVPGLMAVVGLLGAVLGTVLAIAIGRALLLLRAGSLMEVRPVDLLPWRSLGGILGAAGAAAVGALLIRSGLGADPLPRILLTSAAFIALDLAILGGTSLRARGALLRILKEMAAWGLVLSGASHLASRFNRRRSLVLLYHGVHGGALDPILNYGGLHVHAARFERQMRHLAARYHVVPLDQLVTAKPAAGGKPLAAVTFDDGYRNVYEHAYPVLTRLGLPATVFVVTDFLRGRRALWWDELAAMVAASPRCDVRIPIRGVERHFPLGTADQRRRTLRALAQELLALPPRRRDALLAAVGQALGVAERALETPPPMSQDQLREMAGGGISFGGHGCAHDSFLYLSRDQLAVELAESRRVLESITARPVTWLAYPHGEFNRETIEVAGQAGYRGAVTAIEEGLNDGVPDPFAVRRIGVDDGVSFARFVVATSGIRDVWRRLARKEGRDEERTQAARRAVVSGLGRALSPLPAEESGPTD